MIRIAITQLDDRGEPVDDFATEEVELEDDYLVICEGAAEEIDVHVDDSGSDVNVHVVTIVKPKESQ